MNKFNFSVIIRTFNRKKIISKSINSVLNQSYKNFEIIIIDDKSNDDTKKYIKKKYLAKYSSIKYFYINKNVGNIRALETGILKSKGKILCFLDSDDLWHKDFLKEHYKIYQSQKDIDCAYNNTLSIVNGKTIKTHITGFEGNCYKLALQNLKISSQIGLSFKKKCWGKIKKLDYNIVNEDDDLCLRLSKYYKFKYINKNLSFAIHHKSSPGISSDKLNNATNYEQLLNKYKKDIFKFNGKEIYSNHLFILAKKYFLAKKFDHSYNFIKKSIKYKKTIKNIFFIFFLYFFWFYLKYKF
jgi:glycosyltransferase involved in cell wall biosynthesis